MPILLFLLSFSTLAQTTPRGEVLVPAGTYIPFFRDEGETGEPIGPLWVDKQAVSNQEFLAFVRSHPEWKKSQVKSIFADPSYLEHWKGDGQFAGELRNRPVTNISWFAARKYCEAQGKRLLRTAEWEHASDAQNPKNLKLILEWYGQPEVASQKSLTAVNIFGVSGMHGRIWEWVEDFSSAIVGGDSRSQSEMSKSMFCGAGALKAKDPNQYATFMRIAHRSSLRANSVGRQLGFRCARSNSKKQEIP